MKAKVSAWLLKSIRQGHSAAHYYISLC